MRLLPTILLPACLLCSIGSRAQAPAYSISICADVPVNDQPERVYHRRETGHVFLILRKQLPTDTCTLVWGFYPQHPVMSLLFRKVKSSLSSNAGRWYDASLTRPLTAAGYDSLCLLAQQLARRRYHLNRYNCYHYALAVFNHGAPLPIPVQSVRFPLPAGRGGSPVALYRWLRQPASAWPAGYVASLQPAQAPGTQLPGQSLLAAAPTTTASSH